MSAILDWFSREGYVFVSWWLLVALAGAAVLPLCIRLLNSLPDKGYTLARTVGLLLTGFVFWLLASFGFLQNTTGAMLLAWLIVLFLSLWIYFRGEPVNWWGYWRENRRVIIVSELLFLALFFGWTVYRAAQNDTWSTEKPMELAFISGIMRSDTFPPNDPWMAGYSISYYHFGYIMAAMLSKLSGVSSTMGFSMMLALLFGLSGLTAFGVVYNLVRSRTVGADNTDSMAGGRDMARPDNGGGKTAAIICGMLATVFLVLLGNFQFPLIELPYQSRSMPAEYFDYWGTQERTGLAGNYIQQNDGFIITGPDSWGYWWFFRASRVLTDYELDGTLLPGAQPIDEFPQFSFLLGDVHPHVLALPFVVMCIGLALSIVLRERDPNWLETLFYGLAIGGLIFLNTWDGPIYLVVLAGALALRRLMHNSGNLEVADWLKLIRFGLSLLAVAIVAYLPFFIGFRSQAAGVLPNLLYPTQFQHFFLMFGPFLILIGMFLAAELWQGRQAGRNNLSLGLKVAGGTLLALVVFMGLMALISALIPQLNSVVQSAIDQNGGWATVLPGFVTRRLTYAPVTLVLLAGLVVIIARLFPRMRRKPKDEDATLAVTYSPATGFGLMLVGVAVLLTLIPEFLYLRDVFGTRINTIFKFYYQAWVTLSLAGAYGFYVLRTDISPRFGRLVQFVYSLVLFTGLMYPVFGVYARTVVEMNRFGETPDTTPLTLDGGARMPLDQDDYELVMCLNRLVTGDEVIIVEAVRDAYRSYYNRVAAMTGIPSLLGWENHERQWRGPTYDEIVGTRPGDIERLYNIADWNLALEVIERYGIDYIVYGHTERQQYDPAGEEKFIDHLDVACESGDSRIYHVNNNVQPEPQE